MAFVAIYDANVLYPNTLRDLLIRMAQLPGLAQAKWTGRILDEMLDALRKNLPDISEEKAGQLRDRMNRAVRDCLVTDYEPLIDGLDLPDPDDRHVLAAAVKAGAQAIVTWNLKDFPAEKLAPLGVKAKSPEDFVLDQIGIDRQAVWACVQQIVDSRTRRPVTTEDVLNELVGNGLVRAAASLRAGAG